MKPKLIFMKVVKFKWVQTLKTHKLKSVNSPLNTWQLKCLRAWLPDWCIIIHAEPCTVDPLNPNCRDYTTYLKCHQVPDEGTD